MGFWTNKEHRTVLDDAEDLGYQPEGGRLKMWLLGVGLAAVPIAYGIHGLCVGQMTLIGKHRAHLELHGAAAKALAIAVIAAGVFIHFHWFWGIHKKLFPFSPIGKFFSVTIFIWEFWLHDLENHQLGTSHNEVHAHPYRGFYTANFTRN